MSVVRKLGALLVALLLAGAVGCGKKGPPRPPPRLIPAQTADLTVRQTGDRLLLDLTYPAVTTSGLPLAGIEALEVLALRSSAGGVVVDPRTFAAAATVAKRIQGVELAAATRGPRLVVELDAAAGAPWGPMPADDTPVAPAEAPGPPPILIAVRTFGPRGNDSPLSNLVAIVPRTPPSPPDRLDVTSTADGVALAWIPSASAPATVGFDVLRRRVGESSFEARIAQVGADRLEHLDATAVFGDHYQYTVRAVAARDPQVESADGPVRDLEYRDTFAPATPRGLVALAEEGRIRLLWDRVQAPDLAGYRLYRRENDDDETTLERAPGAGNDHVDDRVRAGAVYTYRVTAVDLQGNQSPPSEPAIASPR